MKKNILVFKIILITLTSCYGQKPTDFINLRKVDTAFIEKLIIDKINNERKIHKIKPLVLELRLHKTAEIQSNSLLTEFNHVHEKDSSIKDIPDRLRLACGNDTIFNDTSIFVFCISENCARCAIISKNRNGKSITTYSDIAQQIYLLWKKSHFHHKNYINPNLNYVGCSVSIEKGKLPRDKDGLYFKQINITMVFLSNSKYSNHHLVTLPCWTEKKFKLMKKYHDIFTLTVM